MAVLKGGTVVNGGLSVLGDLYLGGTNTNLALNSITVNDFKLYDSDSTSYTYTLAGGNIGANTTLTMPTVAGTLVITDQANGKVNLGSTTYVTGTLAVGSGGTGATTFTQYGIIYGDTAAALKVTALGADNTVLCGTGVAPAFETNVTITSLTTTGDININGGDINSTGDLTITPAGGNVSIASASADMLHITRSTAANSAIAIKNSSYATYVGINAAGEFGVDFTDADLGTGTSLLITRAGNVGIGLQTPIEKFHVNGNIRIDDASGNDGFNLSFDNVSKTLNFTYAGA